MNASTERSFRLVELQVSYIEGYEARDVDDEVVDKMPTSHRESYKHMMDQVLEYPNLLPRRILSWILHSRDLRMEELIEALEVRDNDTDLGNLTNDKQQVLKVCQSLVAYDEHTSKIVKFAHDTVQGYIRDNHMGQLMSRTDLAKSCLSYIKLNVFGDCCEDEESLQKRLERYKFSRYVAQFWGFHLSGEPEKDLQQTIFDTFHPSTGRLKSMVQIRTYNVGRGFFVPRKTLFFHAVAANGLSTLCEIMLKIEGNN